MKPSDYAAFFLRRIMIPSTTTARIPEMTRMVMLAPLLSGTRSRTCIRSSLPQSAYLNNVDRLMIAGPSSTIKMQGKMNKTRGNRI